MRRRGKNLHGWLFLDKPADISSNQALVKVRQLLDARKAGHAGTLDPFATGMLPIALGDATKTIPFLHTKSKTYTFSVTWGKETDSGDRTGTVIASSDHRPSVDEIDAILPEFIGSISQIPPIYSAIKINGRRAYQLARNGEAVEMAARPAIIHALDRLSSAEGAARAPQTAFRVRCATGTYVRALGRDLGRKLRCYGHVSTLRRTHVGSFTESDMISLDKFVALGHSAAACRELCSQIRPITTVLDDIPAVMVNDNEAVRIRHGGAIQVTDPEKTGYDGVVCYTVVDGNPVAIGQIDAGLFVPNRVFSRE